ncbi:MAG: Gfo/Idh/MocA family oxidoreductase [Verrucomicrobia bacterium]|nr:Gfo/Idh/MocA family oxidoreductase [Verrucomicrobiota bacterium]MDA1086262.1 Gfo/Idh/MocA family oxidoreductase [Verrucomicrobiota bacterium]
MADRVRVGVVGVGSLGQHHARIYAGMPGVELAGIVDSDPQRRAEISAATGAKPIDSIEELYDRVDAVSIAVPTRAHYEVTRSFLERDIHVLVEKPITDDPGHAKALVDLAAERRRVLQVGHVERFNPVMAFLEEHLDHPRFLESIRLATFPPPRPGAEPRGTEVSVILDLMIHDLEIILHLVKSPIQHLHAVGVPVLSNSIDIANARIVFESGAVANVTASRISQEATRKLRVFQEASYLSLDLGQQDGKFFRKDPDGITALDVPIERSDALEKQLAAFVNSIQTGASPVVSGVHGLEALRVACDIQKQIEPGG